MEFMKLLSHICLIGCVLFLTMNSPIVADPPAIGLENAYDTLPITVEEKHLISKLLITMAENNVFQLLLEKRRLEKIGDRINPVHPFRFLGTVFTDPRLTRCMREIRKNGFKWDGFMEGFAERMRGEANRGNLTPYIAGFARAVERDQEEITRYVNNRDFEGLVKFLMM